MEVERTQKRKKAGNTKLSDKLKSQRSPDQDPHIWLNGHPDFANQAPLINTPELKQLLGHFWPATQEYFNPLNAVFSAQVLSLTTLRSRPIWLFRDGLIPLMWFFKTIPSPKGLQSKMILPIKFANVVPQAWQQNVKYYEIVQAPNALADISAIYVAGVIGALQLDLDILRARFAQAKDVLGDRVQKVEKYFYLPSHSGDKRDPTIQFEAYRTIFSELGFNGRPIDWAECVSSRHSTKSTVLSLLSDLVVSDDYVTHVSASKGSYQFHLRAARSAVDIQIPLSPYHGFEIYETTEAAVQAGATKPISREEILKVIGHQIYLALPWPKIYQVWQ